MARGTGSVLCRNAVWGCFWDAVASFMLITRLRRTLSQYLSPKTIPLCNYTQHRTSLPRNLKVANRKT